MTPKITLSAQVAIVETILDRATPHNLRRGGFATRDSEAELIRERLAAVLNTLRIVDRHAPKIRDILWPK